MLQLLVCLLVTAVLAPAQAGDSGVQYSWSLVDRQRGTISGSANQDSFSSTIESMIKTWIAADYLRRHPNQPARLNEVSAMIRDSDDVLAEKLYRLDGGDAVVHRLIMRCGLRQVKIKSGWWSLTSITASDALRLAICLSNGTAAGDWTSWLLNEMRLVRGDVTDQRATSGGGRWGIIDGLPARERLRTSIKNGWTEQGSTWHVNCLAINPSFLLTIIAVYPIDLGLSYGAQICAQVAAQQVHFLPFGQRRVVTSGLVPRLP